MEWLPNIATSGLPWWVTAVLILLTIVCTKGITAWDRWRKGNMEVAQQEHNNDDSLINRLTDRVKVLEDRLDVEQRAHMECVRLTGVLTGRVDQLTQDMAEMIKRHDANNKAQIESNNEAIKATLAKTVAEAVAPKSGDAA